MRIAALLLLLLLIAKGGYAQQSRADLERRRASILESIHESQRQLAETKKNKNATMSQLRALQAKLNARLKLIDNINQETISWPNGTAPSGHYKVVVDYYDDCGVSSSGYDVTVKKNGNTIDTFSGSFNGAAANNSPATAAEFDF